MKNYNIAVIEGDGIGPEIINESLKVLNALEETFPFKFKVKKVLMGGVAIDKTGNPLPDETITACKEADAVLFGAIGDPKYDNDPTLKVRPEQGLLKLRKELKLFANIRPIKAYQSLLDNSPLKNNRIANVDFVIYRELISGIYFGDKEINLEEGYANDNCFYSKEQIIPIAKMAFEAALQRKKKVTLVDKANVLSTSQLWRKVCTELSKDYPEVTFETLFVDNAAMQLIVNPKAFDVILTENMFGDILSDEASVLTSSIGLLPSASVGESHALFEPIHGSYPQAKGKNIANPLGSILSLALLLDYLGEKEAATLIEKSVDILINKNYVTRDIDKDSKYSTQDIGNLITRLVDKTYNEKDFFNKENIELGRSTIV